MRLPVAAIPAIALGLGMAVQAEDCAPDCVCTTPRLLVARDLQVPVTQEALQRQYDALLRMTLETIDYSPLGPVEDLVGDTGIILPPDAPFRLVGGPASDLLPLVKDLLLANGTETLTVRKSWLVHGSERGLLLAESIRGIPVVDGGVSLGYNARTMRVSGVSAHFVPDRDLQRKPKMSWQQAEEIVRAVANSASATSGQIQKGTYLAYFAEFGDPSPPHLVWVAKVGSLKGDVFFFVNAVSGVIVSRENICCNDSL